MNADDDHESTTSTLPDENTPLAGSGVIKRTPIPKLQLAILGLVRISEPIAYTQASPTRTTDALKSHLLTLVFYRFFHT